MKKKLLDWIFHCNKCGHLVYITKSRIKKMLKLDCPNCGEEADENWTFVGEGNFKDWNGRKL